MKVLHIDIETFSHEDIRKVTVYRYIEDPNFLILMAAWSLDGSPVQVAVGEDEIRDIPGLWDPTVLKVAHNAQFERICFSRLKDLPTGEFIPPEEFHDTMAVAAEKGYPQSLEKLAVALGASEKDSAGTRLINLFCKPNRKGERNRPEDYPDEWKEFVEYCRQDVASLVDIDKRLGDFPTEMERAVFHTDQHINDRGIPVDVDMVRKALEASEENRIVHEMELTRLSGIQNPGSQQQMLGWIKENVDTRVSNVQAETIEKLLKRELNDTQRRVLELRKELALVASKKFTAAMRNISADNRLRGSFRFFGAHTGRWSGKGVQLQNLPRSAFKTDAEVDAAILDLLLGLGASAENLKKLVRPMFIGPFTVVDYSAIEARVVAWLAGEQWALDAFAEGRDIYVETAERMGGLTRFQGKVAVLALGYNGGVGSLRAMGGDSMFKNREGVVVPLDGTYSPDELYPVDDEDLDFMVQRWRRTNRNICKFWKDLEEAFRGGGKVGRHIRVEKSGNDRMIRLPSGRYLGYRRCSFSGRKVKFYDPRKGTYIDTYGGRLTENVTQAVARDVLAEAMVRLEVAGHAPVGHVHDEVIVEGSGSVEEVTKVMIEPPDWSGGLPLNGEGFRAPRYRKG